MASLDQTLYKQVAANGSETDDYTPAGGERVCLSYIGGNGCADPQAYVAVIWDPTGTPEILFATHGDASRPAERELVGDGSKKLRILLKNETATPQTIGAWYVAQTYEAAS